jgi:threonine dehydrogenase-like Zn-dependent dehydrogenase
MQVERLVFTAPATCDVETVELDENIGSQEVLIRNRLGLISPGTELAIFTGEHRGFDDPNHWAGYPWWPGYANVGEIVAVGRGVFGLASGDRVVHESTHATFARQHWQSVVKLPDSIPNERAVFFKLVGIAATPQMVAPVGFGEHAVVVGLGMIGNLAAQLCHVAGAWTVHAADPMPGRLATAKQCRISTWDVSERELAGWIAAEIGDAHYVVEAVGLGTTVRDAIRATAPRGRTIILSSPREKIALDPYFDIHHPSTQVIGTHESARDRNERRPYDAFLLDLLASGAVQVEPLVTHRLAFGGGLQAAYEGLRDDPTNWMGVLVVYG